ncbi:MAG: DUF5908 family protein [Methylococcales bacterium]|nr:DUF5908 family protein [Methylococcales bacterium]
MPIEIRELVIKATVGIDSDGGAETSNSSESNAAKEANLNLIVEKVLEILKEKSER